MRLTLGVLVLLAAVPLAGALPLPTEEACLPSCTVLSHTLGGYVSPLVVVPSGSTVTWETLDIVHTSTERVGFCLHVDFNVGSPGSASLEVADGKLYATSEAGEDVECTAALATPDGSFLLDYTCLLHPSMKGQLLVR